MPFFRDGLMWINSCAMLSIVKGQQLEVVPKPLHRIYEDNLLHHVHNTALIYKEDIRSNETPLQTTYLQMNQKANQYARLIVREATQRYSQPNSDGDFIIAVCMQPSDALVTTLMAIWKSGASYLPIDKTFPANRVEHILEDSCPIMVIHDNDVDRTRFAAVPTLTISQLNMSSSEMCVKNLTIEEMLGNDETVLAIILYTSGSTGMPKGVRLPHQAILNRLQWQWNTFPYDKHETVGVFKTALTFGDSIVELWSPLLCGLSIFIVPKAITKHPERLVIILEEYKIRRLVLVPTLLRSLLMYLKLDGNLNAAIPKPERKLLYNLNIWVCSGEPLTVALAKNFYDYFDECTHTLYNLYGSTELTADVTYFKCKSKKQLELFERVPIGIPVTNTIIYLLDSDLRPVKMGEIGEIFVSGLNLANGYVNGGDQEKFLENHLSTELKYSRIYRTGDYGSVRDGYIMYEGRSDSQIKIRGHRVDLLEVEKNVAELSAIDKAIVLCYHAGQIDQTLLAFVKLHDNSPLLTEMELEAKLKYKLIDYMIPQIVLIKQVPLLVNGKVDRQTLLKLYESTNNNVGDSSSVLDFDYSQVPNELITVAKDLFEIVASVIGLSIRATLALHSNFYELGGNSLNTIYTVTLLRNKGYSISISEFIAAKNLDEILQSMTKDKKNITEDIEVWVNACPHLDLEVITLQDCHKNDVKQIIVDSFYGKGDLEQWLKLDILRTDYSDIISDIWNDLVETDLSFVVQDRKTNQIIGAALNFDARQEPEVHVKSKLMIVFEFTEFIEGPIRDTYLTQGYKILHAFLMGTSAALNPQENIACMAFMEYEQLKLAKGKHFNGILAANSSPLTQQLGNDIYKYTEILNYQVNEYVYSDGTRPFGEAPDSQRIIVHWKELSPPTTSLN